MNLKENDTISEYDAVLLDAKGIFTKKVSDYGGIKSVAVMRTPSIIDQLYIKLKRIRTLQEKEYEGKEPEIKENKANEFLGILNYCIIGILIKQYDEKVFTFSKETLIVKYEEVVKEIKELMLKKNSDYGEAWREMYQTSFVDLSLQKIFRAKSLYALKENTLLSEGLIANFQDIANYSIFALILISEKVHTA